MAVRHKIGGAGTAAAMMLLYFFTFGCQYFGNSYFTVYVSALPFATNTTVGAVAAVGALVMAVSSPLWGGAADRARSKNRVLTLALAAAGLTPLLFLLPVRGPVALFAFSILFFASFIAPQSLCDTLVVENISHTRMHFSSVRAFASLGYMAMGLTFALLGDVTDRKAILLAAVSGLLAAGMPLLLPGTPGLARGERSRTDFRTLLRNRKLLLFLAYSFTLFLLAAMLGTFLPVYFATDRGLNLGSGLFGVYCAVSTLAEAILLLACSRLFARMKHWLVFVIPPVAGVLKCAAILAAKTPALFFVAAVFEGLWFAPTWSRTAPYVNELVPPEARATGISLWTIVTFGLARFAGSLIAGVLSDAVGIRGLFFIVSILLALTGLVFGVLLYRQERPTA